MIALTARSSEIAIPRQRPGQTAAGAHPASAGNRGIFIPSATFPLVDRLAALAAAVKPLRGKPGVSPHATMQCRPEGGITPSGKRTRGVEHRWAIETSAHRCHNYPSIRRKQPRLGGVIVAGIA